jgi:CRISPR system Cascade subunit CasC
MILEMHIIQNFAPSNLNRSDTGSPKDCTFGGFRRARVSSQCFKRSMREHFKGSFGSTNSLAIRSTRLLEEIASQLKTGGKEENEAKRVVEAALSGVGLKMSSKDPSKTQYLIFLGRDEIRKIAALCLDNYEALLAITPGETTNLSARDAKKAARGAVPAEISKALQNALDGGKAADLALFGRMLADLPDKSRDASSQVAHAISTHKVGVEFDFYTAVDDLKPDDASGADMLGTIEFNSACFYRYANVDTDKLHENLQGDAELTKATIEAFMQSAINAIPTGKQNSFATHEKPSFVLAVVRDGGLCSLANAFEKPVRATETKGLVEGSVERLDDYWQRINDVYGDGAVMKAYINVSDAQPKNLNGSGVSSIEELISKTTDSLFARQEA